MNERGISPKLIFSEHWMQEGEEMKTNKEIRNALREFYGRDSYGWEIDNPNTVSMADILDDLDLLEKQVQESKEREAKLWELLDRADDIIYEHCSGHTVWLTDLESLRKEHSTG